MGVIEKLNSLITAANTATGSADKDLTAAVQSLISGYGGSAALPDVLEISEIVVDTPIVNGREVLDYFLPLMDQSKSETVIFWRDLGTMPPQNNQLLMLAQHRPTTWPSQSVSKFEQAYRIRNGKYSDFQFDPQYDAKVLVGDVYLMVGFQGVPV